MIIGLLLLSQAPAASARAEQRPLEAMLPHDGVLCYERAYDGGHLKLHPAQKTSYVRLMHRPDIWPVARDRNEVPVFYTLLEIRLRGGKKLYEAGAFCRADGSSALLCERESNSGAFRPTAASGGR